MLTTNKGRPLYHIMDQELDKTKLIPTLEPFRRINSLSLSYLSSIDTINSLIDLRDLELQVDSVDLCITNTEESTSLTNPDYFIKGVDFFQFIIQDFNDLTDEFFKNINDIKPNKLGLKFNYYKIGEYDYYKIFKSLNGCTDLELVKTFPIDSGNLTFVNVPILYKSTNHDFLFMKCKKFDGYLKINEIKSRYGFIKENSNDTLNEKYKFLFIKDSDIFNFYDYTYEGDKEEMIQLQHISSIDKTKLIDDWQFIISTKYLHDVYIGQSLVSMIIKNEKPINLIEEISGASEFMGSVKTTEFINNIDQYISVFPSKCLYSLAGDISIQEEIKKLKNNNVSEIVEKLGGVKISKIHIDLFLSNEELLLMREIVSSKNSKAYLREISLKINYLDDAIKFLHLLSKCHNLELIELKYRTVSLFDMTTTEEEAIRDAKSKFYRKAGFLHNIKIYHK